jgi:hypothetical protein
LAKPGVAEAAGGLFDGFPTFAGFGSGIHFLSVERDLERLGEIGGELLVTVGLIAAQTVVQMGDMEDDSQFWGTGRESPRQGYGIRTAGEADGHTQAGLKQ